MEGLKDFDGKSLNKGDRVAFISNGGKLASGVILGRTDQGILVEETRLVFRPPSELSKI